MGQMITQDSLRANEGGLSQTVAVSTTSAQSAAIGAANDGSGPRSVLFYSDVAVFFRQGSNPTALSNGTDTLLPASVLLRVTGIIPGNKLAFKTSSGTGTVYLTPDI